MIYASLGLLWYWLLKGDSLAETKQTVGYLLVSNGTKELVDGRHLKFSGKLMDSIKNGELSADLLRPIKPYRLSYFMFNGSRTISQLFGLVLVCAGVILGGFGSWVNIVGYVICAGVACCLTYFLNIIVASLAFWMTTATSIRTMIHHIINVLSGALVPIDLFPGVIKSLASFLPFTSLAYLPAMVIKKGINDQTVRLFAVGVVWVLILNKLTKTIWIKGLRKYEAIGI